MAKIRLALICGGKSVEHEISLLSARNIIAALDLTKYELTLLAITKDGSFRFYPDDQHFLENENDPKLVALRNSGFEEVAWRASAEKGQLLVAGHPQQIDVVFPLMHGSFAEDGRMQGFLEMLGLPYVGPDVLASALAMDKEISKKLVSAAGMQVAPYLVFEQNQQAELNYQAIEKVLTVPFFIKPARAGSSVGISKVSRVEEFSQAVQGAFLFDHKILVESAIVGRELECAILGNRDNLLVGEVGEIVAAAEHGFYSYEAKYLDEQGATLIIPSILTPAQRAKIQTWSKEIFALCQCEGMARIDFFLTKQGELFFNEINTIPGFTKISMYPKLMMQATGMSYSALIDQLISLALARQERNSALCFEKIMIK